MRCCLNALVACALISGNAVADGARDASQVRVAAQASTADQAPVARPPALAVALPNVDSCVSRLDLQLDIGYERMGALGQPGCRGVGRSRGMIFRREGSGSFAIWLLARVVRVIRPRRLMFGNCNLY
jgi:hypothetical protein